MIGESHRDFLAWLKRNDKKRSSGKHGMRLSNIEVLTAGSNVTADNAKAIGRLL